MKRLLALMAVVAIPLICFAIEQPGYLPQQAPPATAAAVVIDAPAEASVGELVTLDVSKSNAVSYTWQVVPPTQDFKVFNNGQTAVFSARNGGSFMFIVGCAKGDTVDVKTHTIIVSGGENAPANSFATKIPQWAATVQSDTKRDDALKLAQSFASVAESAKATSGMTPDAMVQATTQSNLKALGKDSLKNWSPFFVSLQNEMKALDDAGKLPDTDAHIVVWGQVADALKKYAETL